MQELLIFQSGTCRVVIPYLDYYGETAFSARLRDRGGMGFDLRSHEGGMRGMMSESGKKEAERRNAVRLFFIPDLQVSPGA